MNDKTIWIWNHYATNTYFDKGGRHYWFAEYLIKDGYNVRVFCASTIHNSDESIDTGGQIYCDKVLDGINYTFIKVPDYSGNGRSRIKNMYAFYKNLFKVYKEYLRAGEKPNAIMASSVHPLTLMAGLKIAKKIGVPCVCEIRDLWPASLIEYNILKKNSAIAKFLYHKEKQIYERADALIFTMEGGRQYIKDQGWDGTVDVSKVNYINNGVVLKSFDESIFKYAFSDNDLESKMFKIVYTGSIRAANQVSNIVDAAVIVAERDPSILFLIYGDGDEREKLVDYCRNNSITNVKFKGRVPKKSIPYVLSKSDLNIMDGNVGELARYGLSGNKLFEYLASGKPIVMDYEENDFGIINKNNAGLAKRLDSSRKLADAILLIKEANAEQYNRWCSNARATAEKFDFEVLTKKLEEVIENSISDYKVM